MPFKKKYASEAEAAAARQESIERANVAARARLTPIEREYRAMRARISSYQKFIREREMPNDASTSRAHRKNFLQVAELREALPSCQERLAELKPQCEAAVAARREARAAKHVRKMRKTSQIDPDYVPPRGASMTSEQKKDADY